MTLTIHENYSSIFGQLSIMIFSRFWIK